MQTIVALRY